jgi:hypothetical protein
MSAASQLADDYDGVMAEVIACAESCSDGEWQALHASEQRSVGVMFDHISEGNPEVARWIGEFLAGRPVAITPEILNSRNADHARRVAGRPRQETVADLKRGAVRTSEVIRALSDEELQRKQDFGWAGAQDVAWVASAAIRHPRGHLKSIRETLGR